MPSAIHQCEIEILYKLRRSLQARYAELLHATSMENDMFKFYLQKLRHLGYVEKIDTGAYRLTGKGKEFANNLDRGARALRKQPKLSLILVVSRKRHDGETEYLFQKRLRQPYFGRWGFLSGPAKWGVDLETSALNELKKQTGLVARFSVNGFYRALDYRKDSDELFEDKLFIVTQTSHPTGTLLHSWRGGTNAWMSKHEFLEQPERFEDTETILETLAKGTLYTTRTRQYADEDY